MKEENLIFNTNLLRLSHCQTLKNIDIWKLLKYDANLTRFETSSVTTLQQKLQFTPQKMMKFMDEYKKINIEKLVNIYQTHSIDYLTYFDDEYPQRLREIYNPPLILFLKGNKQLLRKKSLAIVGTRDSNYYANFVLENIIPSLIKENFIIVSGFAKGVDSLAHTLTINNKGKTIAVLGGGFFNMYPKENEELAAEISKNHLLISEYPPIERVEKWKFPMRNRIISGLSLGTLVVQARKRSGSLITADFALDAGREVFAVPGPINDELATGTNYLIQQGAKLVRNVDDIIVELQ